MCSGATDRARPKGKTHMTPHFETAAWRLPSALRCAAVTGIIALAGAAMAADHDAAGQGEPAATPKTAVKTAVKTGVRTPPPPADVQVQSTSDPKTAGYMVREALGVDTVPNKKLTLVFKAKPSGAPDNPHDAAKNANTSANRRKAAIAQALAGASKTDNTHCSDVHWAYAGENGPEAWGKLKPDFNLCAIGKRQSPINIEEGSTLQGPAEPVRFDYTPSNGTVVNNGHTIQVDVQGENAITVRGSTYRLVQFHFHTPSEELVDFKRFAMVAHLVHKNTEGQLAVVAVLLDEGASSPFIDKVWTYMPLDVGDRVRMPLGLLNLNELLPGDQRYYQFMGSLTTPPCSENVLWMVMKQPVTISRGQFKLFTQLYPNNARPVQPLNGRPVRNAQ